MGCCCTTLTPLRPSEHLLCNAACTQQTLAHLDRVCRDAEASSDKAELEQLRRENQLLKEMLLQERDSALDGQACYAALIGRSLTTGLCI